MIINTLCATIRRILKSINPGEGSTVYLNNAQGESFVVYISKEERKKYTVGDIVKLHKYKELTIDEDEIMTYEKIGEKIG